MSPPPLPASCAVARPGAREALATSPAREPQFSAAKALPRAAPPRLPPELSLHHVARHLESLADVVALADAVAPDLRRAANLWGSEAYHLLQPQQPTRPALAPPATYAATFLRRPKVHSAFYDMQTCWSWETCGAALAGPYLGTAYRTAKLACPSHPLVAASVVREGNIRRWLQVLSALGNYLASAEQTHSGLAAYQDRAFHALALATTLLPEPSEDAALCELRDVLFATVGPIEGLRVAQAFERWARPPHTGADRQPETLSGRSAASVDQSCRTPASTSGDSEERSEK